MIVVVDYGAGNIHSVARALRRVGATFDVTADPAAVATADAVILPGVGAAGDTMRGLRTARVDDPVVSAIARGVPYLGICMGLQVLFDRSEEDDETPCLGVLPGDVVRFPAGLEVPHMGWNQVRQVEDSPPVRGRAAGGKLLFRALLLCSAIGSRPRVRHHQLWAGVHQRRSSRPPLRNPVSPRKERSCGTSNLRQFHSSGRPDTSTRVRLTHGRLCRHRHTRRQVRQPYPGRLRTRDHVLPRTHAKLLATSWTAEPTGSTLWIWMPRAAPCARTLSS